MARLILSMSMSLDGFIAGPDDTLDNPFGDGGDRLHAWLNQDGTDHAGMRPTDEASAVVYDELLATGAVLIGRRLGDFTDYWGGDHHDGVPIFVATHEAPADVDYPNVHFVTDGIESAARQALEAAGDRDVLVHGAYTGRELLQAGLLDVLEIQLIPVLFGRGRLLFDGFEAGQTELELVRTLETPEALHLRYEVRR